MNTLPASLIKIKPNRQRREHDEGAHQELIASIQTTGLLHPIVLRRESGDFYLVAGERRLRAIKEIFELGGSFWHDAEIDGEGKSERNTFTPEGEDGHVPFVNLGDLSPVEAEEAELEENFRRVDLSWQELAGAKSRLLELRRGQNPAIPMAAVTKEAVGVDTVAATQTFTRDVILARNMHRPEVKGAKSAAEAMKMLARVEETERNVEKAAALGKDYLGGKHQVFNEDCLTWLASYTGEKFDVVLMDPPYGMGADEFGDSGGGAAGAHKYDDSAIIFTDVVIPAVEALATITKPDAHAYIFCDFERFGTLKAVLEVTGWTVFRTPLLWFNPSKFRAPWPDKGPQRKYECIVYAVRGDLKVTKVAGDVLTHAADENLGHAAQKPVALYADLLSRSARPGMRVIDLFGGTGPLLPAAHALSTIATVVEKNPASYAIAVTRAQALKEKS